jgi:uncharacterized protein YndB with AHSA1/START domain
MSPHRARLPDGRDVYGLGIYTAFEPMRRLAYLDTFADADGNIATPADYGMSPDHPAETLVEVTFSEPAPGQTKVRLVHHVPAAFPERDAMQQGWREMLDKLGTDAIA